MSQNTDNQKLFDAACEIGNLKYIKLLLEDNHVVPSNNGLQNACVKGHLEVIKLLLADERVDPSAQDNYAIRWASEKGHLEVVKLLLADKKVDPSADDNYALRWASVKGHVEVVKLLEEWTAAKNRWSDTTIDKLRTDGTSDGTSTDAWKQLAFKAILGMSHRGKGNTSTTTDDEMLKIISNIGSSDEKAVLTELKDFVKKQPEGVEIVSGWSSSTKYIALIQDDVFQVKLYAPKLLRNGISWSALSDEETCSYFKQRFPASNKADESTTVSYKEIVDELLKHVNSEKPNSTIIKILGSMINCNEGNKFEYRNW